MNILRFVRCEGSEECHFSGFIRSKGHNCWSTFCPSNSTPYDSFLGISVAIVFLFHDALCSHVLVVVTLESVIYDITKSKRIHVLLHASGLPRNLWGEAACHVVWLMNCTGTKAVKGKTPFEAVFDKKPDLKNIREWGEWILVCVEEGDKLGGHVKEGCWLGLDEESKGVHVYWPDKKSVSVEQNIYYGPTVQNEGEGCRNYAVTHHNSIREHLYNRYYVTITRTKV